jgi:hypothetical protein
MPPHERITLERVRAFIDHLSAHIRPSSVAIAAAHLYDAARLIAPSTDWAWLRAIKSRLTSSARPMDRFDRLVHPVQTLNFGIELMDSALMLPTSGRKPRAETACDPACQPAAGRTCTQFLCRRRPRHWQAH